MVEEEPGAGMLNSILGEEMRDKMESPGKWRKYGNVERDTSKTEIVGGEIGRRAKVHKG